MRCCEAWKLVEDCFDTLSFECIDFQRLNQIFACLTRENLEAREAEVSTLPWTQTEKYIALARCRSGQRARRNKKPVLSLSADTDEEGHPLDNEDDSGRRLCEYWGTIFQAREEGPRHHQHEDILRFVQHAPDDIPLDCTDKTEFDDLLALKEGSAPDPDGIPYGVVVWVRSSSFMLFKPSWREVLFLIVLPKVGPSLSQRHLSFLKTAPLTWNLREQNGDNSLWPEEYDKVVLRVVSFLQWPLTRSSDGSKKLLSQGTPTTWNSCSLHNALTLMISPVLHPRFES